MPRGGKREGAGRPKGSKDNIKQETKMETNNFNKFERELIIEYINHRCGDKSIDNKPLYWISSNSNLNMSLEQLRRNFGPEAAERLRYWFDIDVGHRGVLSVLTLQTGAKQFELYYWLKGQDLLKLIRREPNGIFDSWPDMIEHLIERKAAREAALAAKDKP